VTLSKKAVFKLIITSKKNNESIMNCNVVIVEVDGRLNPNCRGMNAEA